MSKALLSRHLHQIVLLCSILTFTNALVQRWTRTTLSASAADARAAMKTRFRDLLPQSMASSASSAAIPSPKQETPKLLPIFDIDDLRESQRQFVSILAMALTKALVPSTFYTASNRRDLRTQAPGLKLCNLPNDKLAEIILKDSVERQFLFTADMTREIYDDHATFCDGSHIDGSYPMDAWMRGCKFLFDAKLSKCRILKHTLEVSSQQVQFRFSEALTFNAVLRPRVFLTGIVVMKRDADTGLIISYEETWDQNLKDLFRKIKFLI